MRKLCIAIYFCFLTVVLAAQVTYTVNTIDDVDDGTCDSSHCSFREAVILSNNDNQQSSIHFDINGTAPFIIYQGTGGTQFPEILEYTIIDATTQPNWVIGDVIIDGDNYLANNAINSDNNYDLKKIELYGLTIRNFSVGVEIAEGSIIGDLNKGNQFLNNGNDIYSIAATGAGTISISYNSFSSSYGIDILMPGTYCDIIYNNFINCGTAIQGDIGGSIYQNTIQNCSEGIQVWTSDNVNGLYISNNICDNISGTAISAFSIFGGFGPAYLGINSNTITSCNLGISTTGEFADLSNNTISNCNLGVDLNFGFASFSMFGEYINYASNNTLKCNAVPLVSTNDTGGSENPPVIIKTTHNTVEGTILSAADGVTVRLFLVDDSSCPGSSCQGSTYIGSTYTTSSNWSATTNVTLEVGQRITALANHEYLDPISFLGPSILSNFAACHVVQPDVCETAKTIVVNPEPCATTGGVVDMDFLTDSGQGTGSSCDYSYAGNDAWFKLESPSSYNSIARLNINSNINGIAEAYLGDCNTRVLVQCEELDSLPHSIIFENYTPGTNIYLRVWDRNNTVVDAGLGAILHFTAHELDTLQTNWELCDLENNLINGNPTILSERDANSFILAYNDFATPAQIEEARDSMIAGGGALVDTCLCGSNPLELWEHSNPIDMEENKKGARLKASVDTTNYNYHFEPTEFRINIWGDGEQYNSSVSMDEEGNFVVIWEDLERQNVFMRVFKSSGNPILQEIKVGTQSSVQHDPNVSLFGNGDFVTAWHEVPLGVADAYSIYCRLWNADGSAQANAFNLSQLAANSLANNNPLKGLAKYGTKVSLSNDGIDQILATWQSEKYVFIQKFNQSGSLIGQMQQVASHIENGIDPSPKVSMNTSGTFAIAWSGQDANLKGVYVQLYDANQDTIGSVIQVNTIDTLDQNNVDIVIAEDGSFIVTWQSFNQVAMGSDFDIYAKKFDAFGNSQGAEFLVNTYTTDAQKNPNIALLEDGTFFITWDSYGQDGYEEGIFGQFFDSNGIPIENEFQLNAIDEPEQENPSVVTNGGSVVLTTWEDGINDGDGKGIYGQRYEIIDANGQKDFYPIGTATPSTLLGDELTYPGTIYAPADSLASVRVAVIDTGIDPSHPYLSSAIWNNQQVNSGLTCYVNDTLGYDFVNDIPNPVDYDGHGTKVNGIIARDFPSAIQLELMNLKFHEFQKGKVFDAVCAIYYAVDNGADIINMSWGFEASEYPSTLKKAIQYASDNDILMVTTAGNTSKDNDKLNKFPCNLDIPNMIRVTSYEYKSSTNTKRLANYASYGKNNVDIAAYGFVETPTLGDTLELASGTSLAAPHITRTAAIIKGLFPNLTAQDIKDCILNNAAPEAEFSNVVATGGILDHDAAIDCAYDKAANCVAIDLYINVPQSLDTVYRSDVWVETDTEINSNADVEMWGAEYVKMLPGFETTLGTEYLADIDDCDPLNTPNSLQGTGTEESSMLRLRENSVLAGKIKVQFYYEGQEQEMKIYNESGKEVQSYTFAPEKEGWYEKIIDAKLMPTGIYKISLEGEEKNKERLFQVQNKHYKHYLLRAKKRADE